MELGGSLRTHVYTYLDLSLDTVKQKAQTSFLFYIINKKWHMPSRLTYPETAIRILKYCCTTSDL